MIILSVILIISRNNSSIFGNFIFIKKYFLEHLENVEMAKLNFGEKSTFYPIKNVFMRKIFYMKKRSHNKYCF